MAKNAWEYYAGNGREFLREFYNASRKIKTFAR